MGNIKMKQYLYRLFQWVFKGLPVMKVPANVTINRGGKQLAGRKIVVTGGSRGIGYWMAKRFLDEGAGVLISGRDVNRLKQAAEELRCQYLQFDVTDVKSTPAFVEDAARLLGGLDGLVNNAGICNQDNGFLNVTETSYDEQFLTNVKGPFFLTLAFLKYIEVERVNSSSVLFITSERGLYPDDAPYGMTKAAIGNIVAGLARKFATMGVHINAIAPGVVADVLADPKKMEDLYLKGAAGKRFILPQEIAETAVWLMSDASKCVSGEIIPCNQCNHLK